MFQVKMDKLKSKSDFASPVLNTEKNIYFTFRFINFISRDNFS